MKARSLADLGAIKQLLQAQAREAAEREARRREQEARQQRERELFARSVGPVHALKDPGWAMVPRPRPAPRPRQRVLDEQSVLREAISDEFDVETLLDTDETLSFRRPGVGLDVVRRLRRGDWVIQAQIDLHGLRRDEAREQLAAFLREAVRAGLRCVRVVHGKGHGSPGRQPVLKAKVKSWLVQKNEVIAFTQARASDGGAGALVVLLRPSVGHRG
ncbi:MULTISPECIES: Smr/MutS family protein [Caldimonas]|uniref:Smr/MutS family protein n=1 Tax=Caldimonas TaxID=196013 RepID=UPI0003793C85|nr:MULTISPECIES: Smr/MutS family protein [Caldimonas]MCX7661046.1 Smr/MutS family protein [Caldimonas manganoxidans]GIX23260.1 MAG: DNA mismatch repair protein MutS [Caldimonas sp.]